MVDESGTERTFKYPFHKYDATVAPGVSNDNTEGYEEGSIWVDVTGDAVYTCVDNSTGAAVWVQQGGSGGVAWGDITGTLADQTDMADLAQIEALTRAKGALIAGEASAWGLLSVGTDGKVLTADSLELTGLKWATPATGTGDVVGPGAATDNAIARFDGTTGKLIQNSAVTINDAGLTAGMVFTNAGAKIQSVTSSSYNLVVVASGTQTADRTLTVNLEDGSRTLILGGNVQTTINSVYIGSTSPTNTLTLNTTGVTDVYLPTSGTLATVGGSETLTNKTLTTPTIGSFSNANHTHQDSAGGGTLSAAAIASGTLAVARGGTGVGAMQNFSGYRNTNYSIPTASWNKLPIDTERWDVGSAYDAATNYRFTPTVAGTYLVAGHFYSGDPVSNNLYAIAIYKNGSLAVLGSIRQFTATRTNEEFIAFGMVQLNGSTDYVELYGYNGHASVTLTMVGGVNNNQFAGSWLAPSS